MQILWRGKSFFEIRTKNWKGGETNIFVNPDSNFLARLKNKEDVFLLFSSGQEEPIKEKQKETFLIDSPGEYEKGGVFVKGIFYLPKKISKGDEDKNNKEKQAFTFYKIEGERVKVGYLGGIQQKELSPLQLEEIGDVNILIIPINGESKFGPKEAAEIISQIEPQIVIPMDYDEGASGESKLAEFLKIMGIKEYQAENKFKISEKDIQKEKEEIEVVVLRS